MSTDLGLLAQVELFAALAPDELEAIATGSDRLIFGEGQTIVREGDRAEALHIIVRGSARVLVRGRPRRDLSVGDAFGEVALLDGGARSASVYALTAVETLAVPREVFETVRSRNPAFDHHLVLGLCARLRGLEDDRWVSGEELHLRQLQATFLSNASHELRTPLTVALGHVQLALRVSEDERLEQMLGSAEAGLRNLKELIDDLIDLTAVRMKEAQLSVGRYPVHGLVTAAAELAQLDHSLMEVDVPDDLSIEVDGARITRIVAALLENAHKFGPADETIVVRGRGEDEHVTIDVVDAGPGLDPETRAHIFDPFTQRDPSRTRSRGGLGIGLPLARSLARLHGGDVEVVTAAPSTTFRVRLPREPMARDEEGH